MRRLVFLGTPEVAARTLRALVEGGHDVALVVTAPDRRRARRAGASPTPVKAVATELGIPVTERVEEAVGVGASLGVVVAFGRIIAPDVLTRLPMVNLHFSLLPRWRGAAPVERALLAGDPTTGVCLMALEAGLDTGPVYDRREVAIGDDETAAELRARLGGIGTALLLEMLDRPGGLPEPVPQYGEPTYAAKLTPDELRLDFSRSAVECARLVRAGRAWTTFRGRRLLVVAARPTAGAGASGPPGRLAGSGVATGAGVLELVAVQSEGRGPLPFAAWAAGARPAPAEILGA
ncbi:MAG: methionyl-tRNA formyltransferase [Acidimicrobiales bacterium]